MQMKRGNPKALETIALRLKELQGLETKVGWFSSSKYEDGTSVAYVAAIQEIGYGPIPPRPMLRPTAVKEKTSWKDTAAMLAKRVLKGMMTGVQAMDALGQRAEGDVLATIDSTFNPPLSPITIELRAMKKADPDLRITGKIVGAVAAKVKEPGYQTPSGVSTKPLNDSGLMRDTLTHTTDKV